MISLMYPCDGPITQGFGENPLDYAKYGLAGHNGIDIGVVSGTPTKAAEDGEVVEAKWDTTGYGNYVKIRHEDITYGSYYTLYAHLSSYTVMIGQRVIKGQIIAYTGNTGNSTGPHLHFELQLPWSNNISFKNRVDPIPYMEASISTSPGSTVMVQPGKAKVVATAGLNLRSKPDKYSESVGIARYGLDIDWDGNYSTDATGTKWLKLTVYASADWLAYNKNEMKDTFIGFHKNVR